MKLKPLLIIAMVLLCLISSVQAQLNEISGTVTSEDGAALMGASITAKGSKNSVITDANGQFRLSVAAGSILVISYVGHETLEVSTSGKSVINATLKSLTQDLENVVVTVLGFRERGDKVGSSVSRIGTREVINSGETGLLQGMAGKASGVTITRSTGDPGAGSNIKIRGANTITGAAGPLVIVDGIPISNSYLNGFGSDAAGTGVVQQSRLNDINPNDIETLQILKGAAAASLWGSRAANGVIVITTKKGRAGALKISYSSTYSVDEINSRHPMQTTYGQGSNGVYSPTQANSWGDKIANRSGVPDTVTGTAYFLGATTGKKYYRITKKNEKETFVDKNFDGIFGKGQYWQNALSLSGGNDKSRFFFSLENLSQQGIIRENSNYIRNSIRLNSDHNLGKYLRFSNKAAFINVNSNRIQNNSNTAGLYLGLLRTPPDFDNIDYIGTYVDANGVEVRNRHRSYRRYLGDNVQPTYNNPYWTIHRQESPSKVNRFLISSEVSSNPFQWLELILRGGLDASYDDRKYFFPVGSAGERSPGSYREEKISEVEKNIDLIARATKELTPDINGTLIIGGNINDRQRDQLYGESSSFLDNVTLQNFILTPDAGTHIINYRLQRGSNRGYSTASLDYKDQLFLNVGGALEASSTISKSFFYPSADVAWQFNKLPPFQNANFLSFGKIRAAWGKVGVQPTAYNFVTTYEGARYDAYDDGLALTNFGGGFRLDNSKGNADLKPEVKTEWEIGTDLRFLQDRFTLSLSYYQNKIKDILLNVGLPPSSGFTSQYTNAATMENKGFETDFRLGVIKSGGIDVQVYGNYNHNRNKVLSLSGTSSVDLSTQSVSSRAVEGYQLGVLWGPRALRDDKGSYVLDANGFPLVDLSQGVIGDPNPDWRGAAGLSATYKGIDFNILFETFQGGDISQGTKSVLYNFGTHADVGREITLPKDLKNVTGQTFAAGTTVRGNIGNYGAGDVLLDQAWYTSRGAGLGASAIREFYVGDASWTRLREVSLGYTLKSARFTKATRFNSIRFSITGRNLVLWTDIVGFDPEVNQTAVNNGFGTEYFTNPSTRSYLFTITLN